MSAKKTPAKESASNNKSARNRVLPLSREALQLVFQVIAAATIKGGDAEKIVALKLELARVAGISGGQKT